MIRRLAALVLAIAIAVLIAAHVIPLQAAQLTPIVFVGTALAWVCFVVLGSVTASGSRIGALTERTYIALVIAAFGSASVVVMANTDAGYPWFDLDTARLVFRLSALAVLSVPAVWLVLWRLDRLGGAPEADHDHRRVGDARDRSHRREDER